MLRTITQLLCVIPLLWLAACGGGIKAPVEQTSPGGQGTVYDDAVSEGGTSSFENETIDEEEIPYAEEVDGPIEAENLDPALAETALPVWEPVYFEFDQATLTQTSRQQLRDYAVFLKENARVRVLLEGHCDARGTENYNLALGERRAQTVKRFLIGLGTEESRISTISYGELRPAQAGDSEFAHAKNRRVAFLFSR